MYEKLVDLKKQAFTKHEDLLKDELTKPKPDASKVDSLLKVLRSKADAWTRTVETLQEKHLQDGDDVKYLEDEDMLAMVIEKLDSAEKKASAFLQPSTTTPSQTTGETKSHLPSLKLQQFNGNIRNWLPFWSAFEEIHQNKAISDSDKYQYLLQCLPENSTARKAIGGVPVCPKHYPDAIKTLKDTFGKESLLVKVYVRDLLQLVINKSNDKENVDLFELVPQITSQVRNLELLGVTKDQSEDILYPVVEACLPDEILKEWQRSTTYEEKLEKILIFLNKEVQNKMERSLANMDFGSTTGSGKPKQKADRSLDVPTAAVLSNTKADGKSCVFCDGKRHNSKKCYKAETMSIKQKQDILRKMNLCFKCFKPFHRSTPCSVPVSCSKCHGGHFDSMCPGPAMNPMGDNRTTSYMNSASYNQVENGMSGGPNPFASYVQPWNPIPTYQPFTVPQQTSSSQRVATQPRTTTGCVNVNTRSGVALMTLIVAVETDGGMRNARIFIDEGSEESFVQEKVARTLNKELVGKQTLRHQVFGGNISQPQLHKQFKICLTSIDGNHSESFVFNTIPTIAQCIAKPANSKWMDVLRGKGIVLQDQTMFTEDIQFLVGADIAAQIWTGRFERVNKYICAKETVFGWVLEGAEPEGYHEVSVHSANLVTMLMISQLNEEDLWSLEALGITEESRSELRADMENAAVDHFKKTVVRLPDGRYEVSLPWIEGHKRLKCNKSQAMARLNSTTRALKTDGYLQQYHDVFQGWLNDGIIEEVSDIEPADSVEYFMPHRHVIKEGSTTPVRPVFDASAKLKDSISLNECLEKGPNMLEKIPAHMINLRMNKVGVIADIKKAFLQMSVAERDRNVLKFLWWEDLTCSKLKVFRHQRVVFGVKSSPFLLAMTLKHHLESHGKYPEIAKQLMESFYVDNTVYSVDSMEQAEDFKTKAAEILMDGQFDLRGWEFGPSAEEKVVPVLGMLWNTKSDGFMLSVDHLLKRNSPNTKRGLLSDMNSVFDPMGFVAPYTLIPKVMFQKTCQLKDIKWDDELPEDISKVVLNWKNQLPVLYQVKLPRWMSPGTEQKRMSLHCFTDASGVAYGCCVYLRTEDDNGQTTVTLIMSKSRVAPIKKVTIPRLELMGCLIGARLTNQIKQWMGTTDLPTFYHTDSSTALIWITSDKPWNRFTQARVDEIRTLTSPDQWRHVSGDQNPADLPSRGCSLDRLLQCQWWEGPDWLKMPPALWPKSKVEASDAVVMDALKKTVTVAHRQTHSNAFDRFKNHSCYHFSLRTAVCVIKYVDKLKERVVQRKSGMMKILTLQYPGQYVDPEKFSSSFQLGVWTADEVRRAEMSIVKYIQQSSFDGVTDRRLRTLDCFEESETGLIRTKSQLFYGDDSYGIRCPMVLPHEHDVVKAMIMSIHVTNNHAGVFTVMSEVRKQFWITRMRRTVSEVVFRCANCKRFVAQRCEVPSTPLPRDRIKDTVAFDTTGVDLLGPLFLRDGDKIWVALFTCAVYRCVHLEIVKTSSTNCFLRAFRRFVARRGRPSKIYSDNGTNFVGCCNLFRIIDWDHVSRYAVIQRIDWIFNPPTAAWWGGFWERIVGLAKKLLRRILGKNCVDYEEFATILCDVESTLNHRPLTYMSERDGDLLPLIPAYFLSELPVGLPEADVIDAVTLNDQVRYIQHLREELRSRFRKEYLGLLAHSAGQRERTVKPGDVVIVEVDDKRRIDWPLGIVLEVFPGRDGKIRTARVRTASGEYLRPVPRLFLMEASLESSEATAEIPKDDEHVEDVEDTVRHEESSSQSVEEKADPVEEMKESPQPKKNSCQDDIKRTRSGRKIVMPDRYRLGAQLK